MSYRDLFEIASPGSNDSFTDKVVHRAEEENSLKVCKRGISSIYGLSAALVVFAVLAGGAALWLNNNSNNKNVILPSSSETLFAQETEAASFTEFAQTEEPITETDPQNPYNLVIHENKFDIDVSIADMWGDAHTLYVLFEVSGENLDFATDYDRYYTSLAQIGQEEVPADYLYGYGTLIDFAAGNYADSKLESWGLEEGKSYLTLQVGSSFSSSSPLPGSEWKHSVKELGMPLSELRNVEFDHGEHYKRFEEATDTEVFSMTFTANYEPAETLVTVFEGAEKEGDGFLLNSIELSSVSIAFEFYVDDFEAVDYPVIIEPDELPPPPSGYDYHIKFNDGRTEVLFTSTKKVYSIYSGGGTGYYTEDGNQIIRFYIANKNLDISTIEAIIIDGVEFKLNMPS